MISKRKENMNSYEIRDKMITKKGGGGAGIITGGAYRKDKITQEANTTLEVTEKSTGLWATSTATHITNITKHTGQKNRNESAYIRFQTVKVKPTFVKLRSWKCEQKQGGHSSRIKESFSEINLETEELILETEGDPHVPGKSSKEPIKTDTYPYILIKLLNFKQKEF